MSWRAPAVDPSIEIRDHQDAAGWAKALDAILQKHAFLGSTATWFESGSDVVWGTETHVIKLTSPKWREQSRRESRLVAGLPQSLTVNVPRMVAEGEIDGWPYFVMTRVKGIPIGQAWRVADDVTRLAMAQDIGAVTAMLHGSGAGLAEENESTWAKFWTPLLDGLIERHRERFRGEPIPTWIDQIDVYVEEHLGAAAGFGFVHTELLDQHLLVDTQSGQQKVSGMIDFADSRFGAIDYDFAAPVEFIFQGMPGALEAFFRGYKEHEATTDVDQALDPDRRLAWALCHEFGSLKRMLSACPRTRPTSLEALARTLYCR